MAEQDAVERFEYALEQFQLDYAGPHRVPAVIDEAARLFHNETQALREKVEKANKVVDILLEERDSAQKALGEARRLAAMVDGPVPYTASRRAVAAEPLEALLKALIPQPEQEKE